MKICLAVSMLFFSFLAAAQRPVIEKKIKTLTLSDTIAYGAVDRAADFYAITINGQIQRFDKDGKLSVLYKSEETPTLFDPRDGARLFAYFRTDQRYLYFSPSFNVTGSFQIDPAFAIQPWLICPSGDHKLWMLDQADNSLKKINVRDSLVEIEVRVDSTVIGPAQTFSVMREYQNFVFLLSPTKGLSIFNSLGRHLRNIDAAGIGCFNFLGEELYYLHEGKVKFFNLFTTETREMPLPSGYSEVLLTDERIILFTPVTIDIFGFRP